MTVPDKRAAAEMAAVAEKRMMIAADQVDQSVLKRDLIWKRESRL